MITKFQICKALTNAGYNCEATPTGLKIGQFNIIYSDKTGVVQFRQIKFRFIDLMDFIDRLQDEGAHISPNNDHHEKEL